MVCGSEISGGISNITISNCQFIGTDRGTVWRRGRGGYVRDVLVSNLVMRDVTCPVVINCFYRCGLHPDSPAFLPEAQEVNDPTPIFERINLHQIHALGCKAPGIHLWPTRAAHSRPFHFQLLFGSR